MDRLTILMSFRDTRSLYTVPVAHLAAGSVRNVSALVAVGAIQFLVAIALNHAVRTGSRLEFPSETMVMMFVQPRIREDTDKPAGPDLSQLAALLRSASPHLDMERPAIDFSVARNSAASLVAPTLQGDTAQGDVIRYAQEASLLPGEGATVVLRVEVLATGDPGRIDVDASSGSMQVDQAAIRYARTRHWYAGRVNGMTKPMWILWGVRLQA
jgi:TonB family protein